MILIRCEDRNQFGYGNRSRATAIAQYCKRNKLKYSLLYSNKTWGKQLSIDYNCNYLLSQSGTMDEAKELLKRNPLPKDQNNYIFCDGNRFLNSFFKEIKLENLKTILLDDLGFPIRDNLDCVVNPNLYANLELYSNWKTKIFAGSSNVLLREEFFQPTKKFKLKRSILISLGTSNTVELIRLIEQKLISDGFIVRIAINFSAKQMIEAIDEASFVICGASVTLHEVIARKRIPIPIYQVEDQILFVKYLGEKKRPFVNGLNRKNEDVASEILCLINNYINHKIDILNIDNQFHKQSLNAPLLFLKNKKK